MATFLVNSDFPLLIIFSKKHSYEGSNFIFLIQRRKCNYANVCEQCCSLPIESICFFTFVMSQCINFSPYYVNGGDTVKIVFLSKRNFLH